MNKKSHKKPEQYGSFCSILPICILVSILTAVLVALIFSIAFVQSFKFEAKTKLNVAGAFKEAISKQQKDANGIMTISGEAVVDFFTSDKSGFIFASEQNCNACAEFGSRLATAAESAEVTDIYHFEYNGDEDNKAESAARNVAIGKENAPVLIYVRNGVVYDRLDDINSESNLSTFLAKYK